MQIEAEHGRVLLKLGKRFAIPDAERLARTVESLAPMASVTVDFSETREVHDAAFLSLAMALRALGNDVQVVLRGLTMHHARVLKYLGMPPVLALGAPRVAKA
jgi:hypothetical protein